MRKKLKEYKLLVCSDDYCDDLYDEGWYQETINYHEDEPTFKLTIVKEVDFKVMDNYDFVVVDYGLFGDLSISQLKAINKRKNTFVTSAMPRCCVYDEGCMLPYVDFRFEMMYVDLLRYVKEKRK